MGRGPKNIKTVTNANEQHKVTHQLNRAAFAKLAEQVMRVDGAEVFVIVKAGHRETDGSLAPVYIFNNCKEPVNLINEAIVRGAQQASKENPVFSYGKDVRKEYKEDLQDSANIPAVGDFCRKPSRRLPSLASSDANTTAPVVSAAPVPLALPSNFTGNMLVSPEDVVILPSASVEESLPQSDALRLYDIPLSTAAPTSDDLIATEVNKRKRQQRDGDYVLPESDDFDLEEVEKELQTKANRNKKAKTSNAITPTTESTESNTNSKKKGQSSYVSVKGKKRPETGDNAPIFSMDQFINLGNFDKATFDLRIEMQTGKTPSRQGLKKYQKGKAVVRHLQSTVVNEVNGSAFNVTDQRTNEIRSAVIQVDSSTYQQITLTQTIDVQTVQHVQGSANEFQEGATQYLSNALQTFTSEEMDMLNQPQYQSNPGAFSAPQQHQSTIEDVTDADRLPILSTFSYS